MLEIDRFIEACKKTRNEDGSNNAVREIVERAVSESAPLIAALGESRQASMVVF